MTSQFQRLSETDRATISLRVDGVAVTALAQDTVLTAVLCADNKLRTAEFWGEPRAGFCLMGACQDCWIWSASGERVRACTTPAVDGMQLCTRPPELD